MGTYSYGSGQVQTVTVNTAGTYDIVGYGAAGGNANNPNGGTFVVGSGAEATGTFQLTAGEKLEIFVGGVGKTGTYRGSGYGGGGGGGTFVLGEAQGATAYTPLLVAGGGGGGGAGTNSGTGAAAPLALSSTGGAGGTETGDDGSGGGAGLHGNGATGSGYMGSYVGTGGISVTSATTPGAGGTYSGRNSANAGSGGFGGGGAGSAVNNQGGGGGGYTGGNGGGYSSSAAATGGTSFVAATATNASAGSASTENSLNGGKGKVLITQVVCYVTGTLIRTLRGDVAVEALQVGDLVVTASGARRPIKWLGHRDTDCARHPEPRKVWPVRVAAGALGAGLPYADLWLSPNHALCLDDVLYPVRALVHCDLIQQVERATVTYWHVELDSHDILIANGAPAESYLDTGNRSALDNASGVVDLHPDFEPRFTESFCRPYAESGPLVAAARYRLFGAAQASATPAVHLVADGLVLTPARCGNTLTFVVPAGAREVRLASPRRRGDGADIRMLGVLIGAIVIETSAGRHDIALDDPRLFAGFHEVEHSTDGRWRWTDGAAHFAPSLWADADGAFVLRLTGMFDPPADEAAFQVAA